MGERSTLDRLAISGVYIAGIVEAAQAALTGAPDLRRAFPVLNLSGFWNYVPLVFISAATMLWVAERAVMLRRRLTAPETTKAGIEFQRIKLKDEPPPKALNPALAIPVYEPQGTPNLSLARAYDIVQASQWAADHRAGPDAVLREMADKLYLHRLSAWARPEPDGRPEFVTPSEWKGLKLYPMSGQAKGPNGAALHDVQFDEGWVRSVWPSRSARID